MQQQQQQVQLEQQQVQNDTGTVTCSCRLPKGLLAILTSFMYVFLIIFPWVVEIIVITQQSEQSQIITICVCASIQMLISLYGGAMLGNAWRSTQVSKLPERERCANIWCGSITNYKSLLSAGYIIYFLPQWVCTNIIITWVLNGNKVVLPLYAHLLSYMPFLLYAISIFVGYAVTQTRENGYEEVF